MEKIVLITLANGVRVSWYKEDNIEIIQVDGKIHQIYGEIRIQLDTLEVIYSNNGFGFISEKEYIEFVLRNKDIIYNLIHYTKSRKPRKQPKKEYIEYAINRYNRIVHIDEVTSGLKCGCSCIACGEGLIARHGDRNKHSFKHSKGTDCKDGYRQSLVLKLRRKLEELKVLKWPDEIYDMHNLRKEYTGSIKIEGPVYTILSTELNVVLGTSDGEVKTDILVTTIKGKTIAISVYQKEADTDKLNSFKSIGIPTLKISESNIDKMEFELVNPFNTKDLIYKLETYASWKQISKDGLLVSACIRNGIENKDSKQCNDCEYRCYSDESNIICSISSRMTRNQLISYPITQAINARETINSGICPECGGYLDIKKTTKFNRVFIGHRDKWKYKECTWLLDSANEAVSLKREQELISMLKKM